jgi:hypothetical protein
MNVFGRDRNATKKRLRGLAVVSVSAMRFDKALITPPHVHMRPVDGVIRRIYVSQHGDADGATSEHDVTLASSSHVRCDDALHVSRDGRTEFLHRVEYTRRSLCHVLTR